MKQLPREQRPYEKCFMQGEGSLNDTELLAVILRSGTLGNNSLALAQEILKFMESSSYPGLTGLMHVSVQDLMKIHGIGQVKAVQLMHWRTFQKNCQGCCQTADSYEQSLLHSSLLYGRTPP